MRNSRGVLSLVEPEQSVLLGVLATNYRCFTTKNAALCSHLAINAALRSHLAINAALCSHLAINAALCSHLAINAALCSHLAINGARAQHIRLNTECNKNGNGTKMEW